MVSATVSNPARRARIDGWTPARQGAFLDLLRQEWNVQRASARVGMSRRSAYHLRKRDAGFAADWDGALRAAREEAGERLIAALVAATPWARAVFREAARGTSFLSLDPVTSGPSV